MKKNIFAIAIMILFFCSKKTKHDLTIVIEKEKISVLRGVEKHYFSCNKLDTLEKFLNSTTSMFEDNVRNGIRTAVYNNIAVNIVDNISCLQLINILKMINSYCYDMPSDITVMGTDIKVLNKMNFSDKNDWEQSVWLNVSQDRSDSIETEKVKGKVRLFAEDTTSVKLMLNCIKTKTVIDSTIYQICNRYSCLGMRGYYKDKINDSLNTLKWVEDVLSRLR